MLQWVLADFLFGNKGDVPDDARNRIFFNKRPHLLEHLPAVVIKMKGVFCIISTVATNKTQRHLRRGSGLRVLKPKFQSVGKRYTPSRSALTVLGFKCICPLFILSSA